MVVFFNSSVYKNATTASVEWVADCTSTGNNVGNSVTTDSSGNVYITGQYANQFTAFNADGSAFNTTLTVIAAPDTFLVKYNSSGVVQWVARCTSTGNSDNGKSVNTDSSGNVYVTGAYGGIGMTAWNATQVAFGTILALTTAPDVFLVKWNSSGVVQWVARCTSSGASEAGNAVATDSSENVYITGDYTATMTVWNATQVAFSTTLTNSGTDVFLVKWNSSGVVQWVAKCSSISGDSGRSISTDSSDNVYVTGGYGGTMTAFNATQVDFGTTLAVTTATDTFLVKWNSSGVVQWVARCTSAGIADSGNAVATDSSGNVYVTGDYGGTMTAFNATQVAFGTTLAVTTELDAFIVKWNSSGVVQWVASCSTSTGTSDIGFGISIDYADNVYVTGSYSAKMTSWNSNLTSFGTTLAGAVANDVFIVKYDSSGNVQWNVKGTSSSVNDDSFGISVDRLGNIYITGRFDANMTMFDANGMAFGTNLIVSATTDVFTVKYSQRTIPVQVDNSGRVQWVAKCSSTGTDTGRSVKSDNAGNVYVTGEYTATLTAYDATSGAFGTTLAFTGGTDAFIVKYDTSGIVQWVARGTSISAGTDTSRGITTDSAGNAYIVGSYSLLFIAYNADGTSFSTSLSIATATDVFIVKWNTVGTVQWVARCTSSSTSDSGFGIAAGVTGIHITGDYGGTGMTAWNATQVAFGTTLAVSTGLDTFVVKYNSSGLVQWVARCTSAGTTDAGNGIATDSSESVYVTGIYSAVTTAWNATQVAFGTTIAITTSIDAFIVKWNSVGTVQWVARCTSSASSDSGIAVTTDTSDNVYITGDYGATMTAWNSNVTQFATKLDVTTSSDTFLVKWNSAGTVQWVARCTSSGTGDAGNGLVTDSYGNVYLTGNYAGTFTAWNSNVTSFGTTLTNSATDAFIVKWNSSGTVQWLTSISSSGIDIAYGITLDAFGALYVTGQYGSTLTAYNSDGTIFDTTLTSSGTDVFVVKYI